ncbi:MAG: hypothetical protein HN831_05370 [Waddliaceae bacterium]|nr:hypothetical protein [Candidatus Bathyarchaeota archaeon]MBT7264885.1 hypothetical protein [Waddliaceae bacterium]MBT7914648.1 hypothetical protein [Candidatus Bathyarchaeota archaeon]
MAITRIKIRESKKEVPRKKITLTTIEELDRKIHASNTRWLEMTIEHYALSQGVVLQFFRDLHLYGLNEAMAYVRSYAKKGEYREEIIPKIEEIIEKVEIAITEGKEIS